MEGNRRLSVIVGAFVLLALGLSVLAILSLTSEQGIFTKRYPLVARFGNVQGLLVGGPVWLAGKSVGSVSAIQFEPVGSDKPMRVELSVDESVRERIRGDSVASIGTIGVLGDSYVEVNVGTLAASALETGGELQTIDPTNLFAVMAHAADTMSNISKLAVNIDEQVMGPATHALDGVTKLAASLNTVVEAFADEGGGQRTADAIRAVSEIMLAIRDGDGILHQLIYAEYTGDDLGRVRRSLASLESSLAALEDVVTEVRDGRGLLHTVVYGSTDERNVVANFIEAGARLNRVLAKLDSGEGTLGLLLNDPSLYEDLRILLGGAQRSAVVRTLIRMSLDDEK